MDSLSEISRLNQNRTNQLTRETQTNLRKKSLKIMKHFMKRLRTSDWHPCDHYITENVMINWKPIIFKSNAFQIIINVSSIQNISGNNFINKYICGYVYVVSHILRDKGIPAENILSEVYFWIYALLLPGSSSHHMQYNVFLLILWFKTSPVLNNKVFLITFNIW